VEIGRETTGVAAFETRFCHVHIAARSADLLLRNS
jgi:hypothetical protein